MRCRRRAQMGARRVFLFAVASASSLIVLAMVVDWPGMMEGTGERPRSPLPAEFLRGRSPNNESYCRFRYGLPEELVYEEGDLDYAPELGERSSYRVLYNVVEGRRNFTGVVQVTYATHITADFTNYVAELARYWEGPISVAAFVPDADAEIVGKQLLQLCYCLAEMRKVSVHFVFPANETPYYVPVVSSLEPQDCALVDTSHLDSYRKLKNIPYPVNVCRNAAKSAAATRHVLVSDAELMPSEGLASRFASTVATRPRRSGPPRRVFVLPLFEVEAGERLPRTKQELVKMVRSERAVHFHRHTCSHCQRFPGLERWLEFPDTGAVRAFLTVKREYPYHRWEPIYIGTKYDPYYSEKLTWEGQQDKMTQMLEMCLMGYRFVILDGAFLVHWPGIKKDRKKNRSPYWEKNSGQYNAITSRLLSKYNANSKCTVP